jgi:hypothetical protein
MWRDRKANFFDCIAQKIGVMPRIEVWDENNSNFNACDSMHAKGTKEYYWKQTQLSSERAGFDAKIKKEIEPNEGGTVWRDRKA